MALLQICTTPLGQGLLSPVTLMFNRQICGIIPVLDCKSIGQDCDDDHHSKLVDRQHKNNNDASPVFASIPIGSAVVVQQEDGRPWTHGTIVGIGDHNHHDRAYTIQLTPNGRQINVQQMTHQTHTNHNRHIYTVQHNKTISHLDRSIGGHIKQYY